MRAQIIERPQVCQQIHAGFKAMVGELVARLYSRGYAETTVSLYEQGAVHFAFWLARQHIDPSRVKESHIAWRATSPGSCHDIFLNAIARSAACDSIKPFGQNSPTSRRS